MSKKKLGNNPYRKSSDPNKIFGKDKDFVIGVVGIVFTVVTYIIFVFFVTD